MRRINSLLLVFVIAEMAVLLVSCGSSNVTNDILDNVALPGDEIYKERARLLNDISKKSLIDEISTNPESVGICTLCRGTGRIVKNEPKEVKGADEKVKCKECRKKFRPSEGHSHVTCPLCNGKDVYKYNSH